ncbi:MAG TPA: tyrosinase family protein [Xanthobacteraceae bacterium]
MPPGYPPPSGYRPPGGYPPPPGYRPPGYPPPPVPPYPQPPGRVCRIIGGFGYDSSVVPYGQRGAIDELARAILAARATAVEVIGHASPEGPADYNLRLGQRRAESAAAALHAALVRLDAGAAAAIRLQPSSVGEDRAVSADAAANRCVEICYRETPSPRPPGPGPVPPQSRLRTRFDVATLEGRAMLQRYEEAVRRMMAAAEGAPSSWLFQWYTHAVRDDRGKAAELRRIYSSVAAPNRALADQMWNTCQAHHPGNNEQFFLPWHRMYVDFFERLCRRVLNDDSFTLPYWNYSDPASGALPPAFRVNGSPLFRRDRDPAVNAGTPLDQNHPPGFLSPNPALALRTYNPQGVAQGFNDFLDGDLHGNVHVAIGNRRGMGAVPWAANDPIFWLHHSNIDRLWASWNAAGRQNPTDPGWLNQTFTFADESGRPVTGTVRDFNTTEARDYRYARLEPVPGAARATAEAVMSSDAEPDPRPTRVVSSAGGGAPTGIALGAHPIRVNLGPTQESAAPFSEQIEAVGDATRLYLVLGNYRAEAQPGIVYHVYLDLPASPTAPPREGLYIGTMNFFDAVPHGGHPMAGGKTKSFDVTDVVTRLRAEGRLGDAPSVTIVPAGRPASEARPVIGEISLVRQ